MIIFTIPFSYNPLFNELVGEIIPFSITGILVVLLYWYRKKMLIQLPSNKYFNSLKYGLYGYLLFGIVFAIPYYSDVNLLINYTGPLQTMAGKLSPFAQIIYNAGNLLICIMFSELLRKHLSKEVNIEKSAYIFSLTIFPILIYQFFQMFGYDYIFGGLFSTTEDHKYIVDPRYLSLFNVFGLGMYVSMVILFALYFRFKQWKYILVSCVLYSINTGERQTFIMPLAAILVYYIFNYGNIFRKLTRIVVLLGIIYLLLFIIKDSITGVRRLWYSIELVGNSKVMEATGRDVKEIPKIIEAIINWPIHGKGIYNWGYFVGIDSYYADHVVYFNLYQKFGLIGVLIFVSAFIYFLLSIIVRLRYKYERDKLAMILGLMVAFVGMQLLDNFFWFTNTMLLYIYLFSVIFSQIGYSTQKIKYKNVLGE